MADSGLNFSSIVANPTASSWSQAYNAGKLFAVLSLQKPKEEEGASTDPENLGSLGKDLLSTFEQEFFTLETKDLTSIKDAILRTTSKIPGNIKCSFAAAFLADSVLYLFVASAGKIYLKRESKFGSIIDFSDNSPDSVKSASGYLQNGDILIIETEAFSKIVSLQNLADSLDHQTPSEISETLAPRVHEKDEGAASAIIIAFKEEVSDIENLSEAQPEEEAKPEEEPSGEPEIKEPQSQEFAQDMARADKEEESEELSEERKTIEEKIGEASEIEEDYIPPRSSDLNFGPSARDEITPGRRSFLKRFGGIGSFLSRRSFRTSGFSRSRRTLLTVAVIIVSVILVSSVLAINQRQSSRQKALFNEVYAQAQSKYEEGKNLLDLNEDLANESLREAQKILSENKDKFKKGSGEEKKISALLTQVNESLGEGGGPEKPSGAKEVSKSESKYLSIQAENNSNHFAQDSNFVYFVSSDGVARVDKGNDEEETIIEKDFKSVGGLGIYVSNVYVLDKESDSIVKFTESEGEFSEGNYLAEGEEADFSKAVGIGIDGSIYVLSSDGNITKYLRGAQQEFEVSGLKKKLSSPSKIWTSRDSDNIYILDKGNSRVVVLNKEGAFQSEYSASVI
ncbi:MAG: hypothetical protein AAB801_00630, partial [Patescibacteria group bacterium]